MASLWLWCGLAAAALIRPLALDLPYAAGVALKKKKKKKKMILQHLFQLEDCALSPTAGLSRMEGVRPCWGDVRGTFMPKALGES